MTCGLDVEGTRQSAVPWTTDALSPFGIAINLRGPAASIQDLDTVLLRSCVLTRGVVVIRGARVLDEAALAAYASQWGELLTWNFGTVLNLVVQDSPRNYLFTSGNVPLHWDGAFAHAVPSFQIFQCLEAPAPDGGGATVFSHTPTAWRLASPAQRAAWQNVSVTYETEKVAHYGGTVTARLVSKHPVTGDVTLRFAEELNDESLKLNPLHVRMTGLSRAGQEAMMAELRLALYDPRVCYRHHWRAGDIVIADNHALLHGRDAFRRGSPRHLQRVHVL